MTMPNFLVIGAAKAGTTSVYDWLNQHPQIYLTPTKETNFFALEGEVVDYSEGTVSEYYLAGFKTSLDAYVEQFNGVSNESAIGEVCPGYLYHPRAPARVRHYLPAAKLIAIVRNPVERAYSHYLHHVRDGVESCANFSESLKAENVRMRDGWWWGFFYVDQGFYHVQLKRYFDLFDPAQIRVYLYEDLATNRAGLIQDIFRFLGVDETFNPDTSSRHNVTGIPKSRLLQELLSKPNWVTATAKHFLPTKLRRSIANNLRNANLVRPNLQQDVRKQLLEVYGEDIIRLQGLIGRDLSHWLK